MAVAQSTFINRISGSLGGVSITSPSPDRIILFARKDARRSTTNKRNVIRTSFSSASLAWETLTPAARTSWHDYGQSIPRKPSGRRAFFRMFVFRSWYLRLRDIDQPVELDVPSFTGLPYVEGVESLPPIPPSGTINFIVRNTYVDIRYPASGKTCGFTWQVSHPQSHSSARLSSRFSVIQSGGWFVSAGTNRVLKISGLIPNRIYYVKVRISRKVTGIQVSEPIVIRCLSQP